MALFPGVGVATLPSLRTDAREALVVLRLLAHSPVLAGFGAAGGHQRFTVLTCRERHQQTRHVLPDTLARSRKLGGNSDQTDTDTSVSQSYRVIFFIYFFFFVLSRSASRPSRASQPGSLRIQDPSRHFPICFHNTWLQQEAAFSFRPLFNHLLFCGSRKQANRKCVKCPVPTPAQAREPFIIQSLVDFSEKTTRQTRDSLPLVAPSFGVLSNNKVGRAGNIFQPPALSGVFAYHKRSTASQRFSVLEPRGSLAVELCSTAHTTLRTSFQ